MNYNFPLHHFSDYDKADKDSPVLKPGTLLLTGKPFAYALSPKFVDTRCDACFKLEAKSGGTPGVVLSRCGGCQQVRFCNRDCQRKGWAEGHKYECVGLNRMKRPASTFARMLLRIVVKLQKNKDYYDEITRKRVRRRFKDLVSHYADLKEHKVRMEQVETMVAVMQSMLIHHPEIKIPNEVELLGICGRMFVNTFSITDYDNRSIGIGLYLGASIFDHSCQPMAVMTFDGIDIFIRNIREIPVTLPIHNVTICYRDVIKPAEVRRLTLKKGYYFECLCERCKEALHDYPMQAVICQQCETEVCLRVHKQCPKCGYQFTNDYINEVFEAEEVTQAKILEMGDNAFVDVADAYTRILSKLKISETHWMMVEMNGIAFDGSIDLQRWDQAYQHGLRALNGYRRYLYEFDLNLGLMLLKLAKLAWYLEKEKEAKNFITEAKKILDVTHGSDSSFARHHLLPLIREICLCSKFQNGLVMNH